MEAQDATNVELAMNALDRSIEGLRGCRADQYADAVADAFQQVHATIEELMDLLYDAGVVGDSDAVVDPPLTNTPPSA